MFEKDLKYRGQHFFGRTGKGAPFQRGDFKYIILQSIKDKPSYGYEIIKSLRERFFSVYIPSPGSVYPTLQMLEEMGYASSSEQEGKKVYAITDEGRKKLDSQKEFVARLRGEARGWGRERMHNVIEAKRQFDRLSELLRDKARTADADKLTQIREILSKAYDEISKD